MPKLFAVPCTNSGAKSYRIALLAIAGLLGLPHAASSQWTTATVDGSIGSGEYGGTANGSNQLSTNTGQTWYMTWDSNNLYVGITNADLSQGAVIYIGTGGSGTTTGQQYDGTGFSSLPFAAQFVTYFKDGYNEYRTSNGGGWSSQTSDTLTYASNSGNDNTREIAIPWSDITGSGIPASFNFFGYLIGNNSYVYGQVPNDNPGGQIGTNATYTQYFAIVNTGNGTSTPPFSTEDPSEGTFSGTDKSGFFHNTFDPFYRSLEGAVPESTQLTLRFRTLHSTGVYGVDLRAYVFDTASGNTSGPVDTNMPFEQNITINNTEYDVWKVTVTMPSAPSVYYYKFHITEGSTSGFYSDDYLDDYDNLNKDGTGTASDTEPFDSFQVTVYDPNFTTPSWMQTANIYHIFPDRFRNGDPTNDYCVNGSTSGCPSFYGQPPSSNIAVTTWNTLLCDPNDSSGDCYNNFGSIFYGGDLLGVQNELDYIQGFGFDTIYLNPIFYGSSNHRYDTDDFLNIDPALGGNTAFASLVTAMNQRGMQVILDGTFEDASSDSTYFNEYNRFSDVGACQSPSSQWRTWFQFLDNKVPCTTSDYSGWDGFSSLPLLVTSNSAVQQFFFSGTPDNVMLHWYNAGAGGWRFDSAPNIPNAYWHALRPYAKSYNPNGPLIGEIWPNASQWLAGDQFDSTMNYRFRRNVTGFARGQYGWIDNNDNGNDSILPLTPSQFDTANRAVRDDYPPQATAAMMNLLDSHDVNRALYVLTEEQDNGLLQAKQRLELAAIFQFTYIGAPMVFYGDEAAMNAPSRYSGSNGPVGDPYTRAPYPWTDQPGDPTIYGPPDTTVESLYQKLGHLRKQYPALSSSTFVTLLTGDTQQSNTAANTYAYARVGTNQTAVIALNNGSSANTATIPVGAYFPDGTTLVDALSQNTYGVSGGNVTVTIPGVDGNLSDVPGVILLPSPATIDLTPPTGGVALNPNPNQNNWINSTPVGVSISASDSGGSGLSQIRYWVDNGAVSSTNSSPAQTSVSGEGYHTVGARAVDNAGNISSPITAAVNIDLTPPVVTVTGVTNNAAYGYGQAPAAGCQTIDALSGVATNATLNVTGGNGQGYGSYTATCSGGEDNAGNVAQPVGVNYSVSAPTAPMVGTLTSNPSSPATGPGPITFTATFTSQNGGGSADIISAYVLINSTLSGQNACYFWYYQPTNSLLLINNKGTAWQPAVYPGVSTGTLSNAQCSLNLSGTTAIGSGNTLTLTLPVSASSTFVGTQNIYLFTNDHEGLSSGWQHQSNWTWTPQAFTEVAPTATLTSSTPVTGTSPSAFVAAFSTQNGKLYTDLTSMYVLINSSLSGNNACYFWYYQPTNSLLMINNNGTAWQAPVHPNVSTGTISNTQCSLNLAQTTASGSGNTLTLTLPLSANTFVGTQNIYLFAYDSEESGSQWQHQSSWTWTPQAFVEVAPTASLTSPSQATGTGPISFVAAFSTQNGKPYTDLTSMYVLINSSLSGKNACYFWYYPATNSLLMINDTGTTWQTPAVHPNVSTGTLSNAQCSLNVTGTTVSGSGNTLTLTLPVTANTFAGTQNVYLFVSDSEGSKSGWTNQSTWTWTP